MKKLIVDHLGNTYPSIKALCRKYDIPYHIYYYRVKHGYSLYYALSMPVSRKGADDDRVI